MSSRERILTKVRAGIVSGRPAAAVCDDVRQANVVSRLARHDRHLVPARAVGKATDELVVMMRRWLELAGGEVIETASARDVPAAVAAYLRRHNLPQRVRMGTDARLARLPWSVEPQLELLSGRAEPTDTTGLTHALAAVAETGTLMVASGPDNPVTLSFLPETNIALIERSAIVGPLEDAIDRLRAATEENGLPRTVNMISGPSRSADIGGIPVLGAHGPRRFCLIIVGE